MPTRPVRPQGSEQSTRSQLAFIGSMQKQYGEYGLNIILVDESRHKEGTEDETLTNFIYDNELIRISLTRDNITKNIAGEYGVKNIPTTLLVSKKRFVYKRWDNLALPAQPALAIAGQLEIFSLTEKKLSENN